MHTCQKQIICWHTVINAKHQVHKHCIGVFEQVPPQGAGGGGNRYPRTLHRKFFTQALDSHCYHFKVGHECFLVSCSSPYRLVAHFCLWTKAPTWGLGLTKHNDLHTNCPSKAQSHFIVFGHVKAFTNDSPDLPQMCNFVPQIVARQL